MSVGNLTLGGTGKTPCVEYLVKFFRNHDRRVAILSRGYGGRGGPNDEALVLAQNLSEVPHLQGSDRVALAGRAVAEFQSQILVLDDGFQHRRLARDLDILLIDATDPWGCGHLFPRGTLREEQTEMRRAGLIMLTRCDQVEAEVRDRLQETIALYAPHKPVVQTTHRAMDLINSEGSLASLEKLENRPVAAFCGIGNPKAFLKTLTDLGAQVRAFRSFPDHHAYNRADLTDLSTWGSKQAKDCVVVTTQKDLVKLRRVQTGNRELWALRIRLQVGAGRDALDHKLRQVVGAGS